MIISETRLRNVIRNILLENRDFNESYASKLAKLIGSGDLESINQGIELGEAIGMIDRHWTDETESYFGATEKVTFFWLICHKELAAQLREEIESEPYWAVNNGINMYGLTGCNPGGTTVEYPDMPDFCKISFRLRVPAPVRRK